MRNKYSQKLFNSAKISTTDAITTASRRAIQKTAEASVDLICNKIADEITSISKSPKELYSKEFHSQNEEKLEIPKERYISPEKREHVIDELRFV